MSNTQGRGRCGDRIKVKPEKRTIKVIGSAKKRGVSDLIEWDAMLVARATHRTDHVLRERAWTMLPPAFIVAAIFTL